MVVEGFLKRRVQIFRPGVLSPQAAKDVVEEREEQETRAKTQEEEPGDESHLSGFR